MLAMFWIALGETTRSLLLCDPYTCGDCCNGLLDDMMPYVSTARTGQPAQDNGTEVPEHATHLAEQDGHQICLERA